MADSSDPNSGNSHAAYWRANIKVLLILVGVWFFASFGMGIIVVDFLDEFAFMGFPFGFWMAQQGSIVVFLIIIAIYAIVMNRMDKRHGVEEDDVEGQDFEI
jgi:putative solute:sodium symporter small subunit